MFILISSVCIYPSSEEFVLFLHVRNTICDKMPELSATGALGRNERKSLGFLIVRLFVITSQKSTYGCWRCTGVHEGSWQCCLGEVDVCCMVYCVLVHSWLFCLHLSFSVYFSWSNHPWIRCWYNVFQRRLEAARYTHLIVEAHRKAVDIVLILLRVGLSHVCSNLWKSGRMSAALPRATTVIGTSLWRFDILLFWYRVFRSTILPVDW